MSVVTKRNKPIWVSHTKWNEHSLSSPIGQFYHGALWDSALIRGYINYNPNTFRFKNKSMLWAIIHFQFEMLMLIFFVLIYHEF